MGRTSAYGWAVQVTTCANSIAIPTKRSPRFNSTFGRLVCAMVAQGQARREAAVELEAGPLKNASDNGIELHGHRRLTFLLPSVHPDGPTYRWLVKEGNEPPRLTLAQVCYVFPAAQVVSSRRLKRATRDFLRFGAPEGERNSALFAAACDFAARHRPQDEPKRGYCPSRRAAVYPTPKHAGRSPAPYRSRATCEAGSPPIIAGRSLSSKAGRGPVVPAQPTAP